jgi:hypothetical protein
MDKDTIHEPELPGVRTYRSDIDEHAPKKTFGGITFTVPEATVDVVRPEGKNAARPTNVGGKQLFDVERAFNDEMVQEGTIVTDKRHTRRSIGGMLKSAFTEWWSTTQESLEKATETLEFLQPQETPTVTAPETRTSTILEAAQHARQAPRDDHKRG